MKCSIGFPWSACAILVVRNTFSTGGWLAKQWGVDRPPA